MFLSTRPAIQATRFIPRRSAWTLAHAVPVHLSYHVAQPDIGHERYPGQSMVICHGLYGSKANWRGLGKRFATTLGMDVYTVDMRNHGRSPHALPHSSDAMAKDVAAFFKGHGLEHVHLVGHSMGGKAALTLALNPALNTPLASVASLDMAPVNEAIEPVYLDYARAMMEIRNAHIHNRSDADKILAKVEPLESTRQFLLTNAVNIREDDGSTHLGFRIPLQALADSIEELGSFPYSPPPSDLPSAKGAPSGPGPVAAPWLGPALIIRATQAEYVSKPGLAAAHAFFPNLEVVDFDAGHWVHAEKPDDTVRVVSDFVRRAAEAVKKA